MKILLIEDDPRIHDVFRQILHDDHCVLLSAMDGANGVLLFRTQRPDLTFIGVHTRRQIGWEILDKIRQNSSMAPVVVMGTVASQEAERRSMESHCMGYIVKEASAQNFAREVQNIVVHAAHRSQGHLMQREGRMSVVRGAEVGEDSKEGDVVMKLNNSETKGRVLVVDDELIVRNVLERFLTKKGFEAVCVPTGKEALAMVRRERPHIMLLDLRLPDSNGIDILQDVRKIDSGLAVMIITANRDVETAQKAIQLGACDYIVKPFDLNYLETTVAAKLLMVRA